MRDAVAGIASYNIDIFVSWITADVGYSVRRFHHLPRPVVSNLADEWKAVSRPLFQLHKSLSAIIGLPGLVVFAANDEHVASLVARKSHVVVSNRPNFLLFLFRGLRRVPEQRVLNWTGNPQTNCVRGIWRLL